jgi:hypothetical protein
LNGWVLKLFEYDFEIQNRPGSQHVKADVLSRHVAAVVQKREGTDTEEEAEAEVSLSKDTIGQAQSKDEFCQQIINDVKEGKQLPYFLDQDQLLYYGIPNEDLGKLRSVVPVSLREQINRQQHDPVFVDLQRASQNTELLASIDKGCARLHSEV